MKEELSFWGGECYNIETTTELNLDISGLTGSIPPEIGYLINLTSLNIGNNSFTSIPVSICDIPGGSIYVYGNILCNQYNYSCIDWFESEGSEQDQSNCCTGENEEENWEECTDDEGNCLVDIDCLGECGGSAVVDCVGVVPIT